MKKTVFVLPVLLIGFCVSASPAQAGTLETRVNEAFRGIFGRHPSAAENVYWLGRVVRKEKTTFATLQGAMAYHKGLGVSMGSAAPVAPSKKTAAAAASKTTNKNQLTKDTLLTFVRIFGRDPTNTEKAWWRKRISCGEITSQTVLEKSMAFHKSKGVGRGRDTICGQTAAAGTSASGVLRRQVAGLSDHPMGDQVRIGIYKTGGSPIKVTADGQFQIREGGNDIKATLGKDDPVEVSWSDGSYHVRGSGISLDTKKEIRFVPLNQAIMKIVSYNDASTTIPGKNYNRFRGIVEIRKCEGCSELWAINELRTEYYLRGLAETSGTGPEEYIKALGTAARTYVLYHKAVTGGRKHAQGFDIGRTSDDQIYRGYEYEIITPRMASIFNSVRGTILTDAEGDRPVSAVYFSDSDGRTRSAKEVWKTDRFPHLQQSVDDPHHVSSSCQGHCVGMSAQGAFGFAQADGWSFQKILQYYYKGVKLVKAY